VKSALIAKKRGTKLTGAIFFTLILNQNGGKKITQKRSGDNNWNEEKRKERDKEAEPRVGYSAAGAAGPNNTGAIPSSQFNNSTNHDPSQLGSTGGPNQMSSRNGAGAAYFSGGSSGSGVFEQNGSDLVQHLFQQLSVMFSNQNQNQSSCGIVSYSKNFKLSDQIIIDSGATDHMFGNEKFLTNLKLPRNDQYVIVANGMKEKINYIGEMILCNKKINNVLFLKSFPINLLSVRKLTQELNCDAIFSCKNVVFQDRVTGEKIGECFSPKWALSFEFTRTNFLRFGEFD
jgi:hypothetical protein